MITSAHIRRLCLLGLLVVVALVCLGFRLYELQVARHDELTIKRERNVQLMVLREPLRGEIRDIKGNLLATSRYVKKICADPLLINNTYVGNRQRDVAHTLAPLLQIPEADLVKMLEVQIRTNLDGHPRTNRYVVLQRKVEVERWQQIKAAMMQMRFGTGDTKLPRRLREHYANLRRAAIFDEDDQMRVYPNGKLAAHVLGFVGLKDLTTNGNSGLEMEGKDGVELMLDSMLNGVMGWMVSEKDRLGREVATLRKLDVQARPGYHAVLTLDLGLQCIVEAEIAQVMHDLNPVSIAVVAVRPKTGEILALASNPNFDPNHPGDARPEQRRNRVISDVAEPGSTFKVVVVSGALNEHVVTLEDRFDCENGHFSFAGRILRDHEPFGILSVEQILAKSSNIGAAKIGIRFGANALYDYIRRYGFGDVAGIELPGEISGRNLVHPVKEWSKLSVSRIPIGQGIAVTQLQMALAVCAIANQGRLMRPRLVDHLEDDEGNIISRNQSQVVRQVIGPAAAQDMVRAMKTVVSTNGTGLKARLTYYCAAGKTGTAQKPIPGGYSKDKYYSSFIGFFPADNPEICLSVVIDEPPKKTYYGGQVAAPLFKNIAERAANYLNIRPDFLPGENGTNPSERVNLTSTQTP